jgi:hypothetical protein
MRHYAISRKVEGSILSEVIGFLNWLNPSSRNKTLGSIQPLREINAKKKYSCEEKERPKLKAENLNAIYVSII